ncbi:MAG: site-2 protease family protein [Tumebacillaceae bacterium]
MFGGINSDDFLFRAIAFLIAITVHEFSHAFVAYRLGDPTPKMQGRITFNPIAHMDILGTLMILFGPIGWAKPVQFNPYNFKGNKRAGKILTTLAGPLSNLVTAVVFTLLFVLVLDPLVTDGAWSSFFVELVNAVVWLNVLFFIFNLVPLPPLDGYWIVRDLLPRSMANKLDPFEKYGPFVLLLVVVFGWINYVITPPYLAVMEFLRTITGLI